MTDERKDLRDFLFRALTFESEAEFYRSAGIEVGANMVKTEISLLNERLAPFDIARRNDALEMARLYALLYCFENAVRDLIRERLAERIGVDWLEHIPKKAQSIAKQRQDDAIRESWLEGDKLDLLSFCDFGVLSVIMVDLWQHFEDIIPTQHWLRQRMDEMEKARHFVAHNRKLLPAEFARVYMYIADWNKQVGL